MTGRRKALAVGCLGALVVAAALVVWVLARVGPYGEDRLPESASTCARRWSTAPTATPA